jgi:hypothetical protein
MVTPPSIFFLNYITNGGKRQILFCILRRKDFRRKACINLKSCYNKEHKNEAQHRVASFLLYTKEAVLMDALIKQLVQVDKLARQRVSKAKKQRAGALEQLERDKAEVRAEMESAYQQYVAAQEELQQEQQKVASAEIEEKHARVIDKLNAACETNREAWVQSVFDAVTK